MPATNLLICQKRVVSILFANRLSPYAGTASGSNSRYQVTQEITDTILEADAMLVQARISNPGDPYRNTWMSVSADLANGALIPPHIGALGGVEVKVGSTYTPARFASSKAEILAMRAHPALYPDSENWCFVEDSMIYHNGTYGRVWRSQFTKSSVTQSPEQDQSGVICGAVSLLPKDGAVTPEIYSQCGAYFQAYMAMLGGEQVTLPKVEVIENALAA